MYHYAIGDVQGCYEPLMRLLEHIDFNDRQDKLWLVGDLVNRGPQSLEVLRFIKNLTVPAAITLGNHDLYLLSKMFTPITWSNRDDTLGAILTAADKEELGLWLRQQALLVYDTHLNIVMTHAGIAPCWNLNQAIGYAQEIEAVLQSDDYQYYLLHMFGNQSNAWSEQLDGMERLRTITNYLTRMRYCTRMGNLLLEEKNSTLTSQISFAWYEVPNRIPINMDIVFGHWAALQGRCAHPHIHAIDTGCLWGGPLTALRLNDKKRFSVPGQTL